MDHALDRDEASDVIFHQFIGILTAGGVGMFALWISERVRRNANVVDVGWAGGAGAAALFLAVTTPGDPLRRGLVGGLAAVWAFRLAIYLIVHRIVGKPEDGRYVSLRRRFGRFDGVLFLGLFLAQAILIVLFMIPIRVAMAADRPVGDVWDFLGVGVWLTSVLGEAIADRQLAAFRADPDTRGQVCRRGLWRYSRHPNYFFEWLHWWTYPLLAVGAAWWSATLLGPALMAFFLFYVTGIPATEAHALASRGDAYRRYQESTSPFFPWFPRKEST